MKSNDLFFNPGCRALIIGSSGAIGSAIKESLIKRIGIGNVVCLSRAENGLDFMKPKSISVLAKKQVGLFQLIVDATGALEIEGIGPEKSFDSLEHNQMLEQFMVNAIGPALLIKHFMKFLPTKGKVVFVTLSARVGSISDNRLGGWVSYRASKAALNQIIKTAAIENSRRNSQSVFMAIHPGTVRSKLTEKYLGRHAFVEAEEAAKSIIGVIEQKQAKDSGGFYAFNGALIPW